MQGSDMNIVNVIDLPNEVMPVIDELTAQPNIDAVIYYAYECACPAAAITSHSVQRLRPAQRQHHVVERQAYHCVRQTAFARACHQRRARANLWTGFNGPTEIAELLLHLSRNVSSAEAYSVIPVNAWCMVGRASHFACK